VDIKSEEKSARKSKRHDGCSDRRPELHSLNSRASTQDDSERIGNARRHHDRKTRRLTPEQLTEIPGIGEKMVEGKFSCRGRLFPVALRIPRGNGNLSRVSRSQESAERPLEEAVATEEAVEAAGRRRRRNKLGGERKKSLQCSRRGGRLKLGTRNPLIPRSAGSPEAQCKE